MSLSQTAVVGSVGNVGNDIVYFEIGQQKKPQGCSLEMTE